MNETQQAVQTLQKIQNKMQNKIKQIANEPSYGATTVQSNGNVLFINAELPTPGMGGIFKGKKLVGVLESISLDSPLFPLVDNTRLLTLKIRIHNI